MADAEAVPKKKSFFNRPAWVQKHVKPETPTPEKDATSLFSRSVDTHPDILAEQKRNKRLRAEKKVKAAEEKSRAKRRRVSAEDEDGDEEEEEEEDPVISPRRRRTPPPSISRTTSSPRSLTKRFEASAAKRQEKQKPVVIDLGGSSDEDDEEEDKPAARPPIVKEPPKPEPKPSKDEIYEDDPDEQFPELAAKARERARQRKLEAEAKAKDEFAVPTVDPVIQVLVQSKIPDTAPLLVRRKYTQNLRDIRIAWCKRQNFPEDEWPDIYFTYRGHRVFDVATCKSLGVDLDRHGMPVIKGSKRGDEDGDKLVLWATTQELVDQEKKEAEAQKKKEEEEAEGIFRVPEPPKGIRLVLKCKGLENYKLMARPHTPFSKIAGAFRKERSIAADKEISLHFDGEVLDPESTMADSEIEDMDSIEVHIK